MNLVTQQLVHKSYSKVIERLFSESSISSFDGSFDYSFQFRNSIRIHDKGKVNSRTDKLNTE